MPHVLLIEDNYGDARLLIELFKDIEDLTTNYTVTHVERLHDALTCLAIRNDVDVILSDITLPDSSGVDTLQQLTKGAPDLPILFMTGTNDEALALTALQEGAQDYLIKGKIDEYTIGRALQYAIERKRTQNELNAILAKSRADEQRVVALADEKKQLLKLNRIKDDFISLASHQLRTPASAVKQYLGMTVEGYMGDVDQAQLKIIKSAYASNQRQLEVINELLKTAQLDAPRMTLNLQPHSISKIVEAVVANQAPVLESRHQKFILDIDSNAQANVDREEFRLALENLIENASKYSADHTDIKVVVKKDGTHVLIAVSDRGVGLSEHDKAKIFDKFTRINNRLSDTVTGTGLGLYWVKKIVKLHKGSITVESAPDIGSTFTIKVPE